ncbi:MAG: hypothetical protein CSA61_02250 [Neptuniibacter caesariensis]|uniref:Uncharacterized protein n=1 Tax=Neptuniibacter caesariensis TaxID=207954 RepID=A0A2G6JAC1_NEPCE|nr:MAG: hypothetical protein CSA61_02250 [Neptuniibacter caesariensis]
MILRSLLITLLSGIILSAPVVGADKCADVFPGSAYPNDHSAYKLTPLGASDRTLILRRGERLTLRGGTDVFYGNAQISSAAQIRVTGNGTVRLHFNGYLILRDEALINPLGNPENLVIYVNGFLWAEPRSQINAIVNVNGDTTLQRDALVNGALTVGGKFNNQQGRYLFNYDAVNNADFAGMCERSPTPLPAPILEYQFDECSLDSGVTDSAGNHDGTANNSSTTDNEQVINRALDLSANGTLDWVTLPQSSVDFLNDFSVSLWIKTGVSKNQQEILQALGSNASDDEIEIYLVSSDQVRIQVRDRGTTFNAGTTLTDDNWHHILVTREEREVCLYVDGGLADCRNSTRPGQISIGHPSAVILGQEQDAYGGDFDPQQAFDGLMDELKIYNAVLTTAHANQIYTQESAGNNADGSVRAPVNCATPLPAPLAEYRMDELLWDGTSGEVLDNTANAHHASIIDIENGSASTGHVTNIEDGKICRAGRVGRNRSTRSQYAIDTTVDINDDVGNSGSISFWYRSATAWRTDGRKVLFSAATASPDNKYFFLTKEANGRLRFGLENTSDADYRYNSTTAFNFPETEWVHIVTTWDMANQSMTLFVNGSEEINASFPSNLPLGEMLSLYMGDNRTRYIAGGGNASANGDFDEVLIFDQVLDSADVTQIYTNQNAGLNYDGSARVCEIVSLPPAPVADWRFDEDSWNGVDDVLDSSGNDYHGTAFSTSPSSDARLCNSADLTVSGTSDYLQMNKDALDGVEDFTVIVWVKTTATENSTILSVASEHPTVMANEAVMYFSSNNRFWPTITNRVFDSGTRFSRIPAMRDGAWHQLAWTREADSRQSCFYFDGLSQGCRTHPNADDSDPLSVATNGLIIGQEQDSVGGRFDRKQDWEGLLDEMLIFDSVLNQAQISEIRTNIMNSNNWDGSPRSCQAGVDHYTISHDTAGVTCVAEQITITARDSSGAPVDAGGASLSIATTLGKGNWLGALSGTSAFNDATPNDGQAVFTFASGESTAVLQLSYTDLGGNNSETFGFNVTDGAVTESSGAATASDDPDITFALQGLRFVDAAGNAVNIGSQIAGKASDSAPGADDLYIQAIKATDSAPESCSAAFSGSHTVQFSAECELPASCVAVGPQTFSLQSGGNAVSVPLHPETPDTPATFASIDMVFDADAKAPFSFTYNDAGRMQLHARTDVGLGSGDTFTANTASAPFVVRPFAFGFPEITATGVGATDPHSGDETGGAGFTAAGNDFSVAVNAYLYDVADDADSDGIPDAGADVTDNGTTDNFAGDVVLSMANYTPASGAAGQLTGTTTASMLATDGHSDIAVTLQYSEVGSVSIQAGHANYLGVSGLDITSVPEKVGRFYPDHFVLNSATVGAGCSAFTYMQQPFNSVVFQVEARNRFDVRTQNYDNENLNYLDPASFTYHAENADSADGNVLSGRLTYTTTSAINWIAGRYDFTSADFVFQRQGSSAGGLADGPYSSLQLGLSVLTEQDNRAFSAAAMNMNPATSGDCTSSANCTAVKLNGEQDLRYGRVRIQSAHAPETEDLPVPFAMQYWDGSAFVANPDDNCSLIPLTAISFDGNVIDATAASRTVTVGAGSTVGGLNISGADTDAQNGEFNLVFSAPGAATGGNDNTGAFPVSVQATDAWLRYDWDQDGSANDVILPDAIMTFGRARGNDRMIFWQERYQ